MDGEQSKADGVEAYRRAAGAALQAACRQGAFKEAIEAVQLFLPGCPLIGCLRFLQVKRHRRAILLVLHLPSSYQRMIFIVMGPERKDASLRSRSGVKMFSDVVASECACSCRAVWSRLQVQGDGSALGGTDSLHDTAPGQTPRSISARPR